MGIAIKDFFAEFATDIVAELKGAIVSINDINFKVARAGNKHYSKLLTTLVEEHQLTLDLKDDKAEAKSDEIMAEVMSKTILLGWEGELPFKGKKYIYTQANAQMLLALRDFRALVMAHANDRANYRVKEVAAKVKN